MKQSLLLPMALAAVVAASVAPAAAQHRGPDCTPSHATLLRDPGEQLRRAEQALTAGRDGDVWRHLDRAVVALRRAPADRSYHEAKLRQLLRLQAAALLPERFEQAPVAERVRALLGHARVGLRPARAACVAQALIDLPRADAALRCEARTNPSPARRLAALTALLRRAGREHQEHNRAFALRAAVFDRSPQVREGLLAAARGRVAARDVRALATLLAHPRMAARVRTAEALGALGDDVAVDLLLAAAPRAAAGLRRATPGDGTSTRGHVAFVDQSAYVRDVDVEVASAAFIADPRVDALQSGAVLDATVHGTTVVRTIRTIHRAYRRALEQLVGVDPGRDVGRWRERVDAARRR